MSSLTQDPIDRFLQDAERAARQGDRDLALELIVLALDTAPGDPAVLVRAHSVRNMLPEIEGASDSPLFIDESDIGDEEAPPAGETSPSDGDVDDGDDPSSPSVLIEFPDVGDLADDDGGEEEGAPQGGDAEEDGKDRPLDEDELFGDEGFGAPEGGTSGGEAEEDEDLGAPWMTEDGRTLDDLLREGEGRSDRVADEGARDPAARPEPATTSSGTDSGSRAVFVLWPLLLVALASLAIVVLKPGWVDSIERRVFYYTDPHVRAQVAFEDGDYATTRAAVDELIAAREHLAEARLLAGKVALAQGDTASAVEQLQAAVASDEDWEVSIEAGRTLVELTRFEAAAAAHLGAFERGAPSNLWPSIARVLDRAGDASRARRIRDHYERVTGQSISGHEGAGARPEDTPAEDVGDSTSRPDAPASG